MTVIVHRVNTVDELNRLPPKYGVEIDVRAYESQLILSHDPYQSGERLEEYLDAIADRFVVFNIKESGIEEDVVALAEQYGISNHFLLDVEFPYIYAASREDSFRKLAVRFSEAEPVETALENAAFVDWVWVDTNTRLPLTRENYRQLSESGYNICLVSPDRWGRPGDIDQYLRQLDEAGIEIDAVMTAFKHAETWEDHWS